MWKLLDVTNLKKFDLNNVRNKIIVEVTEWVKFKWAKYNANTRNKL